MKALKPMKGMKSMKAMKATAVKGESEPMKATGVKGESEPIEEISLSGGWTKRIMECSNGRKWTNYKCPEGHIYASKPDARVRGKCKEAWCK